MKELKTVVRYDACYNCDNSDCALYKDDSGEFVKYSDYKKLLDEYLLLLNDKNKQSKHLE